MKFITSVITACVLAVVAFLVIGSVIKCDHEETATMYIFTANEGVEFSTTRPVCKECGEAFEYTNFKGTPTDQSYLQAIKDHSDGSGVVPGEYYTVTATVPLGFYGFSSQDVWLTCQVENEEFIVRFNVKFKEEYRELVSSVGKEDEITFRGRFNDEGCGFTDCELITD